jgi:hypothetical protein
MRVPTSTFGPARLENLAMSETTRSGGDLLASRLAIIGARFPDLAALLSRIQPDREQVRMVPSRRDGCPGMEVRGGDGAWIPLHAAEDPVAEARQLVSGVPLEGRSLVVVYGAGAGYHLEVLVAAIDANARLLIVEPDARRLAASLAESPAWDAVLAHPCWALISGELPDEWRAGLFDAAVSLALPNMRVSILVHPVVGAVDALDRDELVGLVDQLLSWAIVNLGDVEDSLLGLENMLANLHHVVASPDVRRLHGLLAGVPAVCVSSGPSLEASIDDLRGLSGRAIILAADSIASRLVDEGILPDIVGVLERSPKIFEKIFEKSSLPSEVVLAARPVVDPRIIDGHGGQVLMTMNAAMFGEAQLALEVGLGSLAVATGSSVAHLNYSIAAALGCDPIILIGQDLSFDPRGLTHAGGTCWEGTSYRDLISQGILEERDIVKVSGEDGEPLLTSRVLRSFLIVFEALIARHGGRTWNATRGGARIRGTRRVVLSDGMLDDASVYSSAIFKQALADPDRAGRQASLAVWLDREALAIRDLVTDAGRLSRQLRTVERDPTAIGMDAKLTWAMHDLFHQRFQRPLTSAATGVPLTGLSVLVRRLSGEVTVDDMVQLARDGLEVVDVLRDIFLRTARLLESASERWR